MTGRIGFGDLTDTGVLGAAQSLYNSLQANGCQQAVDPTVQAFQQAYVDAGGSLPADSGGRSGVDGYYGANTAAALQAVLNANGISATAPAGCVGSASGGAGGGGGSTVLSNGQSATSTSSVASFVNNVPGGWWTVAAVAAVGVALIYEGTSHHAVMSGPHRAGKAIHHHARRVMKRRGKVRRRRH